MSDDALSEFDASESDTLEATVNGRRYEFDERDVPGLKAMFEDLEIEGADSPELEWTALTRTDGEWVVE